MIKEVEDLSVRHHLLLAQIQLYEPLLECSWPPEEDPVLSIRQYAPRRLCPFDEIEDLVYRDPVLEIEVKAADSFSQVSAVPFDGKERGRMAVELFCAPSLGVDESFPFRTEEGEIGPLDLVLEELGLWLH